MLIELNDLETKNIQIEILNYFVKVCKENNIRYYLAYGTLIGAVRHEGYIPWDDDIDIVMFRSDLEKFSSLDLHENFYLLNSSNNKNFPFPFSKLCKRNTHVEERIDLKNLELGINIDIFPLDNVIDQTRVKSSHIRNSIFLRKFIDIKLVKLKKERSIVKNMILLIGKLILKPFSANMLAKIIVKNSTKDRFQETTKIANIVWGYGWNVNWMGYTLVDK